MKLTRLLLWRWTAISRRWLTSAKAFTAWCRNLYSSIKNEQRGKARIAHEKELRDPDDVFIGAEARRQELARQAKRREAKRKKANTMPSGIKQSRKAKRY